MCFLRNMSPFLAILILALGCGGDEPTSPGENTKGSLKILLTDAPAAFDHVNITFSEVAVNAQTDTTQNGWIVIESEPQTFDLLTLSNGLTAVLGEREFAPGQYGQIRLKLTKAEVVVGGETFNLDVPSGATSGLKLGGGFTIEPGVATELVADFDAAASIHTMGKKGGYKLNPRLRLVAKATTGSITGRVINPDALPVAYAISGSDTISTAFVKTDTGNFVLGFLPAGTYAVSLADTLGRKFSNSGVAVTVGQAASLGDITLTKVVFAKR
ncbi:MAG: DUF4382 domain-containing protein [Candidatus Latescibacterota bacterium]